MSLLSPPAHQEPAEGQDRSLALPEKRDLNSMMTRPQPHRAATDYPGLSSPLASTNIIYSSLPSPRRPTPEKGRRKPVPSMTGQDLDDSLSQRHLSEDISRYPSTISGHIGQATRDDRFAHATGPYHLVPVDEFGVRVNVPRQVKMMSNESRDPTCSSFEAFVLAPSTSSFTIYDKLKPTTDKVHQDESTEQVVEEAEGKERKVPIGPSPLQNQVKVSMESRRTVTCTKQSSDTVRSGHGIVDTTQSITKSSKTSWSLFSRLNTSLHTEPSGQQDKDDSDPDDQSSPTKPSPRSTVSPSTPRHLRKLSVQPVSPFQVPPLSHDVSRRKNAARIADASTDDQQMEVRATSISSPASAKTIKSFSALHRPSMDTPIAAQKYRGRASSDVTPTKQKRQPPRAEAASLGRNVDPSAGTFPQAPPVVLPDPPRRVNSGIKLVTNDHPSTLPASRSGLPRVDTRYLDDDDLCLRLEAHERDHRIGKEPGTTDADVQSGYWDYSIVTGIGGSPSRDYLSLLRNASMMKEFSKITDVTRNQEQSMPPRTNAEPTVAPSSSARATHIRNTSTLTAPRSSSEKSLTCSSNYPDDTDISENSHNKYSEKRRGRHARRRRPVSMASLAAPLGEEPVEGVHQAGDLEAEAEALRDDVTEVADECQPSLQVCARGDVLGSITPAESSFAQVSVTSLIVVILLISSPPQSLPEVTTDTEASTLFTRFPPQSSPPSAAQSEHFKSFGIGLRFPVPPQSQKHSSLLSEILAVTRDSYQARKESQNQATSASLEEKSAEPAPRSVAASQSGRNQRTSFVGTRNGDPSLQVIHEHEVAAANLPLTSESLRELNRRLEEESAPRGGFATARAGSSRDLNLQINGTQAGMPSMVDAGVAATRQNLEQPRSPESQDNLSLAMTTTIRPSFQVSQARSTRTAGRNHRTVINQPVRSAIPLRPMGGDIAQRGDDELAEGIFDHRRESDALCVCFGRRLW